MTHLFKTRFLCLTSFTPHNHTLNDLGKLMMVILTDKDPEPHGVECFGQSHVCTWQS